VSGGAYFDSSALVAVYVSGPFSARARREIAAAGTIAFTPLHDLEVRNALRALRGRGALIPEQQRAFETLLDEDVRTGRLAVTPLDFSAVFRRASKLSAAHTSRLLCRSLDILHVAAAVELDATKLVSGDERQLALAAAVGLACEDVRH
jgi:predicted nucleic acid-binding protein